jgi:sugar/nucleoside kinase (ribokinase family)
MILVAGESLIDLIVEPDGQVRANPGGGPFNAARTIARLGHATQFLGRFSADPFGQLLMGKLSEDGVSVALPDPVDNPTALATVAVSALGVPRYLFHLARTAGFMLDQLTAQRALEAARVLVEAGARSVLVTDGPAIIRMFAGTEHLTVPVPPADVVDTVGAGDAFGGSFLAWWVERGLGREHLADPAQLRAAGTAAARVASVTCSRAGADPPWRHELAASDGWGPLPVQLGST